MSSEYKIPAQIHYCWLGGVLPDWVKYYIESWKKFCPDYKIILWNEDNYDIYKIPYIAEAAAQKRWAFVSDYARLDVIYQYGGIYLDTDVELIKSLDDLRKYEAYVGYGSQKTINTGLGFGAVAGHPMIGRMLHEYDEVHFVNVDGTLNDQPCTIYNTKPYIERGLTQDNTFQMISGVAVLPMEYLSAKDLKTGLVTLTANSYSIHQYTCSGHIGYGKQILEAKQKIRVKFGDEKHSSISKMLIFLVYKYYGLRYHMEQRDVITKILEKIQRLRSTKCNY